MVDYECSKKLLYVFNFVFWIGGAGLLAFGIWMMLDPTLVNYLVVVNLKGSDPLLSYASFVFIGAGGLSLIIGFFGCCGAMRGSQGLLFIYIAFLLLIMAGEIVGGVLALLYRGKIETHLRASMVEQIREDYMPGNKEYTAWNWLQQEHTCCGGAGYGDYVDSEWWNSTRTVVANMTQIQSVPISCCKPDPDSIASCQRDAKAEFTGEDSALYVAPCYDALESWIMQHSLIMMILGLAIGGAQIFSFIAACCVRSALKSRAYENS